MRQLAQAHLSRLRADYRKVYVANLLGAAGAFVAGFGSLQAGLASNIGAGLVLASRWSDLRCLARASRRRDIIRLSAPTEELEAEIIGSVSHDGREETLIEGFVEALQVDADDQRRVIDRRRVASRMEKRGGPMVDVRDHLLTYSIDILS